MLEWGWVKLNSRQSELRKKSQMVLTAPRQLVLFCDGMKAFQDMISCVKLRA